MQKLLTTLLLSLSLQGCLGTIISEAADATLAVAKVPFKAGGAIIDVVSDDDDDNKKPEKKEK
jgi:hypothetical protein